MRRRQRYGGGTVANRCAWWGSEDRAKRINQSVELFEKKYPKTKVKTDFQDCVAFWEKFQTQAAGGNSPDVFQNSVTFLRKYDKRGFLLDLKSQIDVGNPSMDGFRNGVEKVGQVDGEQVGIPAGANTVSLVIDKKVLDKAGVEPERGWTWDEFSDALKRIHDTRNVAGDTGCFGIMYLYDLYPRQNGKAFFTKDGLGFSQADLTEWRTDGCNRVKAGLVTDPKKVEQVKPKSALAPGFAAAEFTWDNFAVRYDSEGDSTYVLAPIPIGGEGTGLLREAVKGVTGLRRDPGAAVQAAQFAGERLPDPSTWDQRVTTRLQYIPERATTPSPSSPPTASPCASAPGRGTAGSAPAAAAGFGYVGGPSGGFSSGLRDFWEKFPAQPDVRDAHTDEAEVTRWLWSPEAQPMDPRFYHDGMGQDTYARQTEGLDITYEDYEPGFGTPYGIARTSELLFWANAPTPAPEKPAEQVAAVRVPPQLAAPPAQLIGAGVFGPGLYSEPGRSPRPRRGSRTTWTSSSPTTRTRWSSAAGTASGATATSCTATTRSATSGATTWAATPGTTPSSRPTCGCGSPACARAARRSSASPRR
ncbi:hypothetical protein GCM10010358_51830 [Streptomyces minutiscleroticus]|uniref:PcRGLX/YetA-like central beta-sandwich domain-containing protein n=1 Tax=Streptomyces minutiscleroticus TaxID=68238 RepID=A0A918U4M5_9ACTN|nr:hypothetical protein GCM10010358_51830 [Streptomyces minutiscleroticus]